MQAEKKEKTFQPFLPFGYLIDVQHKVIRSGKAIENFNALVWSISGHTFCKFLRARKRGTTVYMTELLESSENVEAEYERKEQELLFSEAVTKRLFLNENGTFRQNYYFVRKEEAEQLLELIEEFAVIAKPYFDAAWKLVLSEYEKTVPKHLHGQMGNFLSNHLNLFVTCSLYAGMKNEALSAPGVEGKEWLSLFSMEV